MSDNFNIVSVDKFADQLPFPSVDAAVEMFRSAYISHMQSDGKYTLTSLNVRRKERECVFLLIGNPMLATDAVLHDVKKEIKERYGE